MKKQYSYYISGCLLLIAAIVLGIFLGRYYKTFSFMCCFKITWYGIFSGAVLICGGAVIAKIKKLSNQLGVLAPYKKSGRIYRIIGMLFLLLGVGLAYPLTAFRDVRDGFELQILWHDFFQYVMYGICACSIFVVTGGIIENLKRILTHFQTGNKILSQPSQNTITPQSSNHSANKGFIFIIIGILCLFLGIATSIFLNRFEDGFTVKDNCLFIMYGIIVCSILIVTGGALDRLNLFMKNIAAVNPAKDDCEIPYSKEKQPF